MKFPTTRSGLRYSPLVNEQIAPNGNYKKINNFLWSLVQSKLLHCLVGLAFLGFSAGRQNDAQDELGKIYKGQEQQGFKENRKLLRIAQIATLEETVPPKMYGGTERVVSYLTEELVSRGHEVTLFASSDSVTSARLVANVPHLRTNPVPNRDAPFKWLLNQVRDRAKQFDILHFHSDYYQLWIVNEIYKDNHSSILMTMHSQMSFAPDFGTRYRHLPIVTISQEQRSHAIGQPNYVATVYHGIPPDLHKFMDRHGGKPYLAFLGRIAPDKGPLKAIEIAIQAGILLRMAAKVDPFDQKYWDEKVKPVLEQHKEVVEFIGEVNETEKSAFLGNAMALLFPIEWHEPFGLVMIEAMACGTPVVARRMGSVPEVIEEGVSGLIFDTVEEGVAAVKKVASIDRAGVRRAFEQRFTVEKMVDGYEELYYERLDISTRNGG